VVVTNKKRFSLLVFVVLAVFTVLLLRLWHLQVVRGDHYRALSENNRIRCMPLPSPRGSIFDRNGELLVGNRPSFSLMALPLEIDDPESLFERLLPILGCDRETLDRYWRKVKRQPRHLPLVLAEDLEVERVEQLEENGVDLPGVFIESRPMRFYPHGDLAANLLGYLGQITEEELAKRGSENEKYYPGDFIGKSGLEKSLENELRGEPGERFIEVNVRGKKLRSLQTKEPKPGRSIRLTIDWKLQKAAEMAFGTEAGSAVVLNVHNGEVLAMVSRPGFSPAHFARGISSEEWQELIRDVRNPLSNKAIHGQYPPGSTFKMVTALAALESRMAYPERRVFCPGSAQFGTRRFRCWKRGGHGSVNLHEALRESCDVWFYQVGYEMGIDRLSRMAFALGLGEKTGIELKGERKGLIPTREWKLRRFKQRWFDGETVNASIGQGFVSVTPLQLAVMTAAIANGGTVYRPHVVAEIKSLTDDTGAYNKEPEVIRFLPLGERNLRAVRDGMMAVVNERRGTAWKSRLKSVSIAGKTGSAQVVKQRERISRSQERHIPYRFRDHALYVAFAPADKPEIAVSVVVEHGMHGGSVAAPICHNIIGHYFNPALPVKGADNEIPEDEYGEE
jgi:penicillin-binding protein 2